MHYILAKILHKYQSFVQLIEEQQVIDTNDIFDLAVIHPPHDEANQFTTRHDTNHTRS